MSILARHFYSEARRTIAGLAAASVMKTSHPNVWILLLAIPFAGQRSVRAREITVTGHVTLIDSGAHGKPRDNSGAVLWLTPVSGLTANSVRVPDVPPQRFRLVQKNKRFTPHILVVPVGSVVDFPNLDPFFHNVFSLFDGKRFDLGLYEGGTNRAVNFNAAGVCYVFCNIHPEMSAVVVVVKTPYYGVSNGTGALSIPRLPPGRYELNVWHERCLPDTLKEATREVVVSSSSSSLGDIRLAESGDLLKNHKNKYGRDYDTQSPSERPYELP
jgi:plastocyanin